MTTSAISEPTESPPKTPVQLAILELADLMEAENRTLFDQGDVLVRLALSDRWMREVARHFSRTEATMRLRERVSRQYPRDQRNPRAAWGVHKVLLGIEDEEERLRVLHSRHLTIEEAEKAVRSWRKAHPKGGTPSPTPPSADAERVQGFKLTWPNGMSVIVHGEVMSDGEAKITFFHPLSGEPVVSTDKYETRVFFDPADVFDNDEDDDD